MRQNQQSHTEGIESRLFEEGSKAESGILYMLEEQIEHGFYQEHKQITPLSILMQSEQAPERITCEKLMR